MQIMMDTKVVSVYRSEHNSNAEKKAREEKISNLNQELLRLIAQKKVAEEGLEQFRGAVVLCKQQEYGLAHTGLFFKM